MLRPAESSDATPTKLDQFVKSGEVCGPPGATWCCVQGKQRSVG